MKGILTDDEKGLVRGRGGRGGVWKGKEKEKNRLLLFLCHVQRIPSGPVTPSVQDKGG